HMLGYSLDELLQHNIGDITHPDDLGSNLQARREVMAGQEGSEIFEKRYLHKSGKPVWARLVGSPMYDEHGNISGLFAMVENIDERKQAEDALRRMQREMASSEQRLHHITRATLDLIWDWDLVKPYLWWGEGSE